MRNFKKLFAGLLVSTTILAAIPTGANAEWRQNSIGWRYAQVNSYATGWKQINQNWYYFDIFGYMCKGWLLIDGAWYYINDNGTMASNITFPEGAIGADGKWIAKPREPQKLFPASFYTTPQLQPETLVNHEWYGRNELEKEEVSLDRNYFNMNFDVDNSGKDLKITYTAQGKISFIDTKTKGVIKSIKFDDILTDKDIKDGYYIIVKDGLTIRIATTGNNEMEFLGKDIKALGILNKG